MFGHGCVALKSVTTISHFPLTLARRLCRQSPAAGALGTALGSQCMGTACGAESFRRDCVEVWVVRRRGCAEHVQSAQRGFVSERSARSLCVRVHKPWPPGRRRGGIMVESDYGVFSRGRPSRRGWQLNSRGQWPSAHVGLLPLTRSQIVLRRKTGRGVFMGVHPHGSGFQWGGLISRRSRNKAIAHL